MVFAATAKINKKDYAQEKKSTAGDVVTQRCVCGFETRTPPGPAPFCRKCIRATHTHSFETIAKTNPLSRILSACASLIGRALLRIQRHVPYRSVATRLNGGECGVGLSDVENVEETRHRSRLLRVHQELSFSGALCVRLHTVKRPGLDSFVVRGR